MHAKGLYAICHSPSNLLQLECPSAMDKLYSLSRCTSIAITQSVETLTNITFFSPLSASDCLRLEENIFYGVTDEGDK